MPKHCSRDFHAKTKPLWPMIRITARDMGCGGGGVMHSRSSFTCPFCPAHLTLTSSLNRGQP
eukprot:8456340-Pyramimonas_sp.AAC.1